MITNILYAFVLLGAVAAAEAGTKFSPSFTAIFALAFLGFTTLGEIFGFRRRNPFPADMERLCGFLGAACTIPAALVYAAQDDWFVPCMRIAPVAGAVLHLALWQLLYRRRGRKLGIVKGAENWILLTSIAFTLPSAVNSPGLWPFGLGMLAILAAKRLTDVGGRVWISRAAMALGMYLCAAFLVAPMVF